MTDYCDGPHSKAGATNSVRWAHLQVGEKSDSTIRVRRKEKRCLISGYLDQVTVRIDGCYLEGNSRANVSIAKATNATP
jgi:hypothetical protein